jgi:hypothetical protein
MHHDHVGGVLQRPVQQYLATAVNA